MIEYNHVGLIRALMEEREFKTAHSDLSTYYRTKALLLATEFGLPDMSDPMKYSMVMRVIITLLDKANRIPLTYWGGWMCYTPTSDIEQAIHDKYSMQYATEAMAAKVTLVKSIEELLILLFPDVVNKKVAHDTLIAKGLPAKAPDPDNYF